MRETRLSCVLWATRVSPRPRPQCPQWVAFRPHPLRPPGCGWCRALSGSSVAVAKGRPARALPAPPLPAGRDERGMGSGRGQPHCVARRQLSFCSWRPTSGSATVLRLGSRQRPRCGSGTEGRWEGTRGTRSPPQPREPRAGGLRWVGGRRGPGWGSRLPPNSPPGPRPPSSSPKADGGTACGFGVPLAHGEERPMNAEQAKSETLRVSGMEFAGLGPVGGAGVGVARVCWSRAGSRQMSF